MPRSGTSIAEGRRAAIRRRLPAALNLCVLSACALIAGGCAGSDSRGPTSPSGPGGPSGASYTLSGRVTESAPTQSEPVIGADVKLLSASTPATVLAQTNSSSDGTFSLSVPAGGGLIEASRAGFTASRRQIAIDRDLRDVRLELIPEGTREWTLRGDCGSASATGLTFPVHRAGQVRLEGTARGFTLDWVLLTLSLNDPGRELASQVWGIADPGAVAIVDVAVAGGEMYSARVKLDLCYPFELRVTAPK